jgi:hypothetical protein
LENIPKIVLVGGFLGAGKTTLILAAARRLEASGQRVGIVVNDQDSELVDTKYARAQRFDTMEVAGGCFCCRFSDLLDRAKELLALQPDVIFAEPVGSCIDLSATILQPFRAYHRDLFETAPLTVLLDPKLTEEVLKSEAAPEIAYLFQQQIREADIVCMTKADVYPATPELPFPLDFHISARSGLGVDSWLDDVLGGKRVVGARLLDVDYQQYAEAEAALAWLNLHAAIRLREPVSPAGLIGPLLDTLNTGLSARAVTIAHLKLFDQTRNAHVMVSIRANGQEPEPQGDLIAESSTEHQVAINLRALGDLAALRDLVERTISEIDGSVDIRHFRVFHPAPPQPEHRFANVARF